MRHRPASLLLIRALKLQGFVTLEGPNLGANEDCGQIKPYNLPGSPVIRGTGRPVVRPLSNAAKLLTEITSSLGGEQFDIAEVAYQSSERVLQSPKLKQGQGHKKE
jgi:hypothetical protein